uniref:THAP-type domain-containing protein n=1 Tax=Haplochromis burtoni TaxID=8153 RepID=A0A3Q2V0B2_HAPBU
MVHICCAVGCSGRSRRLVWIAAVRRADISSLPSPNICWCSTHFHSDPSLYGSCTQSLFLCCHDLYG